MSNFFERYQKADSALREECNRQVEDGELTQEEADFRFYMVRDEILESMGNIEYNMDDIDDLETAERIIQSGHF